MKYSEILCEGYFHIVLTRRHRELVDAYYLASAHHRARMLEGGAVENFHRWLHLAHLRALMLTIHQNGDFQWATDPSGDGQNRRENWDPDLISIPDERMFDDMPADVRFGAGEKHPFDQLLINPKLVRPIRFELLGSRFLIGNG